MTTGVPKRLPRTPSRSIVDRVMKGTVFLCRRGWPEHSFLKYCRSSYKRPSVNSSVTMQWHFLFENLRVIEKLLVILAFIAPKVTCMNALSYVSRSDSWYNTPTLFEHIVIQNDTCNVIETRTRHDINIRVYEWCGPSLRAYVDHEGAERHGRCYNPRSSVRLSIWITHRASPAPGLDLVM